MSYTEGANTFNSDTLTQHLAEIDKADDEIDGFRDVFKEDCQPARARIKNVMAQVKHSGLNVTAFRQVVAEHRSERRLAKRVAAMEDDDKADYDVMCDALGDLVGTPLGAAALARARPRGEEALNTL